MNAEQCEFLAEQQPIDILPNFNEPILHLIGGDFGPFEAGIVARGVPVWLAVYLKKCHKCKILAPSWLTIDELHAMVSAEKATDTFTPVPEHFCELAHILLHAAADDLQVCLGANL
jgi:GINS complex subunit 2